MRATASVLATTKPFSFPPTKPQPAPAAGDHHSVSHLSSHFLPSSSDPRRLHARLLVAGFAGDAVLSTNLLAAYSRHRRLLISAISRSGHPRTAVSLFRSMLRSSTSPYPADEFTLPTVLRSCAALATPALAASLHSTSLKLALSSNPYVASALIFSYTNLSMLSHARALFDETPQRDAVLYTTMISGYSQSSDPVPAFDIFRAMSSEGIEPDAVVMVSLLLACGQLGNFTQGRAVHGSSVRRCLGLPLSLGNALVDAYVKCGAFRSAELVFQLMPRRDVITWSALILGHGLNGHADVALRLFEEMGGEGGVGPNSVTFLGVLSACGHTGLVEKAWACFGTMRHRGVEPELKHYACMVDVLGRAGRLLEAERFVEEMPMEPDEAVLGALLSGCRVHGDVEVGERVSMKLMRMRPDKSGYYVILANMYSDAGRYNDAERVRSFMKQMNVDKLPGCSSIELEGGSSVSRPTRKKRRKKMRCRRG